MTQRRPMIRDPRKGAWRRMLHIALSASLASLVVTSAAGALFAGFHEAASVVIGAGVVIILYAPSIAVVDFVDRRAPELTIPLYLIAFVVKFMVLGLLLAVVPVPVWLHAGWGAFSAVLTLVVWQAASIRVFRSMRLHIDPDAAAASTRDPRSGTR